MKPTYEDYIYLISEAGYWDYVPWDDFNSLGSLGWNLDLVIDSDIETSDEPGYSLGIL